MQKWGNKSLKKTILVSGASGIVGYGCLKSLRRSENYKLIGTSIYNSIVAQKFSDIFLVAPHTNSKEYLDWLTNTIRLYHVDVIIPGIEIDMYEWNKHRSELEQTGAKILLNNKDLIESCKDKWKFFLKLNEKAPELAIPTFLENGYEQIIDLVGTPFIMKPINGYGSKGVVLIHDEIEYRFYNEKSQKVNIIQKFIQGEEYTVGTIFDNESKLHSYICMKRKLSSSGYTEEAEVVDIPNMKQCLEKLSLIFKPIGITNFQFICDEKKIRLLEINPRISSSNYIRTLFGYNECEMGVNLLLNNELPDHISIKRGKAVRYVEEVIQYDRSNI